MIEIPSWVYSALKTMAGPAWQWFSKPRLDITALPEDPFIKHTETALPGMTLMQAMDRKWLNYYRLKVTNKGRKQAQGCRILVTNVQYVEHEVWREVNGWEPVTLKWSLRGVPAVDISPGEEAYCDVGHVVSNYIQNNVYRQDRPRRLGRTDSDHHALFYLDTDQQPNRQYGAFAFGDYVLRLRLVTSNTGTINFALYLKFMGQFASLLAEIPEGTVFEVPTNPPGVNTVFHARS